MVLVLLQSQIDLLVTISKISCTSKQQGDVRTGICITMALALLQCQTDLLVNTSKTFFTSKQQGDVQTNICTMMILEGSQREKQIY